MAEPDPLLDEYQDEKDRETEVGLDNPAASVGSPVPDDLDEIAPASPVAPAPPPAIDLTDPAASVAPMPGAAPAVPGALPAVPGAVPDVNARTATAVDLSNRQGAVDVEKANTQTGTAQRMADAALEADDDARLEHADYLKRRQDAEADLDHRVKAYESARLEDPRKKGNGLRATLSVIFGGLGAAFRSAGGGDATNQSLALLQKRWDDDTELQKANIAALKDGAVMARTRLADVDEGRRRMQRDADARLVSKYNLALKQGEAQLRGQGVPQAQIDADARILKLREGQATATARARKDEDEHALVQARAAALKAKADRDAAKARGGGGTSKKEQRAVAREARADSREERQDAAGTIKEVNDALHEFKAKGGIKDSLEHADRTLAQLDADPTNPTNWVHAIDGAIRSVTGRAAIKAQFDLYMSHSHGTGDTFETWLDKLKSGLPSPEQQKNIRGALGMTRAELARDAKDFHDNFRENYDNDDRLRGNPRAWEAYNRINRSTFGTLPGYQKPEGTAAPHGPPSGGPAKPPRPSDGDLARMRKAKARGIHDFDAIIEQYRGS